MTEARSQRPSMTELIDAVDRGVEDDRHRLYCHVLNNIQLRGKLVYQRVGFTPADIRDYEEITAILDRRETSVGAA